MTFDDWLIYCKWPGFEQLLEHRDTNCSVFVEQSSKGKE